MENTTSLRSYTVGKTGTTEKVLLSCRQVYRIQNQNKAMQIQGIKGTVYVTLPNDSEDYILQAGERLVVGSRGLILVQGLPEGAFWYSVG